MKGSKTTLLFVLIVSILFGQWGARSADVPTAQAKPLAVLTIAQARSQTLGTTVTVQGTVTVKAGSYNAGFAIQDDTAGIYIYPSSFVNVSPGQTVILTGTLAAYNCLLEITPSSSNVRVTGSAPVPDPLAYTTGGIGESSEGWLVVITGTVAGRPSNPFTVNDGSGAAQVYVDTDTGISLTGVNNGDRVRVVGFSSQYDNAAPCDAGWQVMPRMQSDLTVLDTTPPTVTATLPTSGTTGVSPYQPVYATFDEALDPTTVSTSTFRVRGPGGAVTGSVTYHAPTRQAAFTPGAHLEFLQVHTATLSTGIKDTAGNAMAADYVWSFTTGPEDTTPPSITAHYPVTNATNVPVSANVVVTFSEDIKPTTLIGNIYLAGRFGAVPAALTYDAAKRAATLNPSSSLLPTSRYTATVKAGVTDWAGLPLGADTVWSFSTSAEPPMQAYHGDIHNHTSISDGSGTPQQALATGKAAGFEFMAITDHSYAISDGEWSDTLDAVNAATQDGVFVALRGFEYTQGAEGHINVYNTLRHATRNQVAGCSFCDYTPNLEKGVTVQGFYPWLAITGTQALDGAGTLMQFNHPGWINFNDWTFHPEVSNTARLEEVGNGSGTSYAFSEDEYIRSLDYGWKVGATNNADTHSPDWGTNTEHRTGAWMAGLTKADLLEALQARRTFATEDKNYELRMKANGTWMGQTLPNTGQITFDIYGFDPDGETTTLVQLITNQGKVAAQTVPGASTFTWQPALTITPGAHYYYVKATQPDGDRIVSSPVWVESVEDVAITDMTVQPSIPTIYNPSLFTARVTNRGPSTRTVTVTFTVNTSIIGVVPVTVGACKIGPCSDGYANVTWQPAATGPVTATASLSGTPAGDSPDDNSRTLYLQATDVKIPLVLIDNGHNNIGGAPRDARLFANDLTEHGYNVLFNLDTIAAADLNTETVKLLILNAYGPNQLTADEISAIADFVEAGGSLWLNGMSDYTGKVAWANTVADRMNGLVGAIETRVSAAVPIRLNDDEVLDGNDNNGYPWGVLWHTFPASSTTGVGMNVIKIQSWSECSLVDGGGQDLTQADLGSNGFLFVQGDQDAGTGTYGEPNRTHNTDADGEGDYYQYNGTSNIAAGGAGYDIPGRPGRLFFYGDANDPFNVFAYTAGDGKQNELFNLEVVMWLLGEPLHKSTVAAARYDAELDNTPDKLDQLVWVEGEITAGFGEFFNVLYLQDDTGGVTVHAPAGDISATQYARGAHVRAVGTLGIYNGDTEIEFFEAEQVQVITPTAHIEPAAIPMSTYSASLEINEGWLVRVTGVVQSKTANQDAIVVDDGTGPIRAFLDGYNGDLTDVDVWRTVVVTGLVSEDGDGRRIRVRSRPSAHPTLPDDVKLLGYAAPEIVGVSPAKDATGVLPDALVRVTFDQPMDAATLAGAFSLRSATASVAGAASYDAASSTFTFTPTASLAFGTRYTATVSTTARSAHNVPLAQPYTWSFLIAGPPALTLTKTVEIAQAPVHLGDVVTYTLTLANSGASEATGAVLTDSLPSGLTFGGFVLANGATQTGGMVTWTGSLAAAGQQQVIFTATVNMDYDLYGQTITNTATFHSDNAGSGSDQAAFTLIGAPALALVKTVAPSADVPLGGALTYTLTLANSGASEASGVVLTDVLPSGVTFGGFVLANGATQTGGMVTWTGSLAAAGQQQIVFTATLGSDAALYGQTITNTATFNSDNAGSGSHKVAFTVVQVTEPSVSAAKTSSADGQVMPGDRVTYTLLLTNTGGVNATVYITDHLGSYYTVYDALDLTESPTGTLTWSGVVTAGQSVALHFVVQVKGLANLPSGLTDLGNSATVYDGVHTPFHISDPSAPWVRVYNVYLPIVVQNH